MLLKFNFDTLVKTNLVFYDLLWLNLKKKITYYRILEFDLQAWGICIENVVNFKYKKMYTFL